MKLYSAPVEDILFSLNAAVGSQAPSHWDAAQCADILGHFANFVESEIAPLDEPGDEQGCALSADGVRMPDGFKAAYTALAHGGWQGLTAPELYGGMDQNALVAAAVSEVFAGANHSMQMVCNLVPGAISTLLRYGTKDQQQTWVPRLAAGVALSTMCLTEPDAGSDLSRIRTQARVDVHGWRIHGEKIFISGGDQDLSEDILHLVLARSGEPDSGVKGLSLFICSKSESGDSIKVSRIERKLGLHASPTCQLTFTDAPAQLIGDEGDGLKAMFTLMNHARIDVSLQGVAHAARACDIANSYAMQRSQGRKVDGAPAMLSDHADVRRMLDEQRSLSLGARCMAHITLVELVKNDRPALVDFLTPVCKVFCTEAGIRSADLGIQILGGYGYISEYRVSQTWRDARITAIYEGANGIHEAAIANRGLRTLDGRGADEFDELITELASNNKSVCALQDRWRFERDEIMKLDDPSAHAHAFAQLTCELFFQAAWVRLNSVSDDVEISRLLRGVLLRA